MVVMSDNINGRQSTGRQCPQLFMHFVLVFIFVNYRAGLTLSRIWWHRLRDHCLSMKVQNVVMFVVMPLSKCQYLLTFHKTWTSAQSMPASSLASTKCATGSSETVFFSWHGELSAERTSSVWCLSCTSGKGTAAAVPPPFRFGDSALCGSHPLVTP